MCCFVKLITIDFNMRLTSILAALADNIVDLQAQSQALISRREERPADASKLVRSGRETGSLTTCALKGCQRSL